MTITVTSIVAGPYPATGGAQNLPFAFKVFTPSEVEVVTGVGSSQVTVDPDLYTVNRNMALDGQVLEGGSIDLQAGAVEAGLVIRAIAKPRMTQEQVWSDTSSRLKNMNEGLDRAALRALRAQYDGALEGAGPDLIAAAEEAGAAAGAAAAPGAAAAAVEAVLPPLLEGKADTGLGNATFNVLGYQRPVTAIIGNQIFGPSDLGSWETDPEAYNDATLNELLGNTNESKIDVPVRLLGGLTVPENHLVHSTDNSDLSLDPAQSFGGIGTPLIFANAVGTGITFEAGAKARGLTAIKECATGVFTSIKQVLDAIDLFSGTSFLADSIPGIENTEYTAIGWGLSGRINGCERFLMQGLKLDSEAGLDITDIFDASWAKRTSRYPLTAQAFLRYYVSPGNPAYAALDAGGKARRRWEVGCCNVRSGYGIKISPLAGLGSGTGADGVKIDDFLSYGSNRPIWGQDVNACMFTKMWLDNAIGCIATAANIAAYNSLSAGDKSFVQQWYNKTDAERAANPGLDPYIYKWHPLYGHYQPFGPVLEGNCQNTQMDVVHSDSAYFNFAFFPAAGTVGPTMGQLTTGSAVAAQVLLGSGEGEIGSLQYAGAGDTVIGVAAGVENWNIGMRGRGSTATNIVTFADAADSPKVAIDAPRWVHNGVRRVPLVAARPTGNPGPISGAADVVWGTETTDRGNHLNVVNGVFTASDHGFVEVEGYVAFTPGAATAGQHELTLKMNGNALRSKVEVSADTLKHGVKVSMRVFCNKGDTLNFSINHGVASTWVGAESYVTFTGTN